MMRSTPSVTIRIHGGSSSPHCGNSGYAASARPAARYWVVAADLTTYQSRPAVRSSVLLVAASTLAGFFAVSLAGSAVMPGEEYADKAALRPVADGPSGRVGTLLPDVDLSAKTHTVAATELRPAVLLLVSPGCDCIDRARHVAAQADGSGVRVYLVGAGSRGPIDRLAGRTGRGVTPLLDTDGRLRRALTVAGEAMLVLVRPDGVIAAIVDDVPADIDLGNRLRSLLRVP